MYQLFFKRVTFYHIVSCQKPSLPQCVQFLCCLVIVVLPNCFQVQILLFILFILSLVFAVSCVVLLCQKRGFLPQGLALCTFPKGHSAASCVLQALFSRNVRCLPMGPCQRTVKQQLTSKSATFFTTLSWFCRNSLSTEICHMEVFYQFLSYSWYLLSPRKYWCFSWFYHLNIFSPHLQVHGLFIFLSQQFQNFIQLETLLVLWNIIIFQKWA